MNPTSSSAPWPNATAVTAVVDTVLGSAKPPRCLPGLTYLRRKPGRGLVAVYGKASDPQSMYTVTVEESAVSAQPGPAGVEAPPDAAEGLDRDAVRIPGLGLTIQRFPHDQGLLDLAASVSAAPGTVLWRRLEEIARNSLGADATGDASLASLEALPLRYKPGDRCVIRYRLVLERSPGSREQLTVIGKLYRDLNQARSASALQDWLWAAHGGEPWLARPLGLVEPLPLVLTEDLGSSSGQPPTLVGTDVIRFGTAQPTAALHEAATALADLHAGGTTPHGTPARTGEDEAAKAAKRAATLMRHAPELADTTSAVATRLERMLRSLPSDGLGPAHGSYKPSQLLFRSGQVFVVDFDQYCRADPALDVGYFLAYLRPPGLWYRRAGTRSWFEEAAASFLDSYAARLAERGVDAVTRAGILHRCHVYEAALLLKIAARRPNRLHSARVAEIRALLAEVSTCLGGADEPPVKVLVSPGT